MGKVVVDAAVEVHRELGLDFKPNQAVQRMRLRRVAHFFVLLIAGIVSFVGLVVVLILNSKPSEPVKVTLQSYTNGQAVIVITNQGSISFDYVAAVEHNIRGKWLDGMTANMSSLPASQFGSLGPGQQTSLAIKVLEKPFPWRIALFCGRTARANSLCVRAGVWCENHGLHSVANKLFGEGEFKIATLEMAQIGSVNKK